MAWLGEELAAEEQGGRTPLRRAAPGRAEGGIRRPARPVVEPRPLFADTTSLYFEAPRPDAGPARLQQDHRPGPQADDLAVVIDGDGRPVCSRCVGQAADVTTLIAVVDRLRRRFAIGRVCVVADRGMVSAETIAAPEARVSCSTFSARAHGQAGA